MAAAAAASSEFADAVAGTFAQIDAHGHGSISFAQLLGWWKREAKQHGGGIADEALREAQAAFVLHDLSGTGSIELVEMEPLLRALDLLRYAQDSDSSGSADSGSEGDLVANDAEEIAAAEAGAAATSAVTEQAALALAAEAVVAAAAAAAQEQEIARLQKQAQNDTADAIADTIVVCAAAAAATASSAQSYADSLQEQLSLAEQTLQSGAAQNIELRGQIQTLSQQLQPALAANLPVEGSKPTKQKIMSVAMDYITGDGGATFATQRIAGIHIAHPDIDEQSEQDAMAKGVWISGQVEELQETKAHVQTLQSRVAQLLADASDQRNAYTDDIEDTLSSASGRIQSLEDRLSAKEARIERLQDERSHSAKMLGEQVRIHESEALLSRESIEALTEKVNLQKKAYSKQVVQSDKVYDQLMSKRSSWEKGIELLTSDLLEKEVEISSAQLNMAQLLTDLTSAEEQTEQQADHIAALESDVERRDAAITCLLAANDAAAASKTARSEVANVYDDSLRRIDTLEADLTAKEATIKRLLDANDAAVDAVARHTQQDRTIAELYAQLDLKDSESQKLATTTAAAVASSTRSRLQEQSMQEAEIKHLQIQLTNKDETMQQALRLHAETLHAAELHVVTIAELRKDLAFVRGYIVEPPRSHRGATTMGSFRTWKRGDDD